MAVNFISTEFLQYSLIDITKIFYTNPDDLLPLLRDILGNPNLNKKSRKKVIRFEKFIRNKNKLNFAKANFYLRNIAKYLTNYNKDTKTQSDTVKVLDLNTNNINDKSDLPYIYGHLRKKGENKSSGLTLFGMLVDSGSETNLISSTMLEKIGLNINAIERTEQYNIKSSTNMVKNCILGRIQINMDLLLRSEDGNINNFARTKITFLVSGPKVALTKIILGTPFLGTDDRCVG